MDTLLSVLLYLNAIHPGNYTCSTLTQITNANRSQILQVESSPTLTAYILQTYESEEDGVVVTDWITGNCHLQNPR
jgi:coenzyme F420-reducing hydrogenase delta subunit